MPQEELKDTIGAGDVFTASFLAAFLRDKTLEQSARFANKMAAKSIKGEGRNQYPTSEDYNHFFKKF